MMVEHRKSVLSVRRCHGVVGLALAAGFLAASACSSRTSELGAACAEYYASGGCCEQLAAGAIGATCSAEREELERQIAAGQPPSAFEVACQASLDAARAAGACGSGSGDGGPGEGRVGDVDAPAAPEICQRYVTCTALVTPAALSAVTEAYGPAGTCFETLSAEVCIQGCSEGLAQLRALLGGTPEAVCAECASDAECLDSTRPECAPGGACVECVTDGFCDGATPVCDQASNTCVACATDTDCPSAAAPVCDVATQTCVAGCTSDVHCSSPLAPYCKLVSHQCVECVNNSQCTDPEGPVCLPLKSSCGCTWGFECATGHCSATSRTCCTPGICLAGECGAKLDDCAGKVQCPTCPNNGTCIPFNYWQGGGFYGHCNTVGQPCAPGGADCAPPERCLFDRIVKAYACSKDVEGSSCL